jgi:lysyl-tRNA synthetase class 2
VREVCALAEIRGLRLGVVGACDGMAELWGRAGLRSFYLGDEAVVDTRTFAVDKKRRKKVRQAVNRVERAGYTIALRHGCDLSAPEIAELEAVSARWRDGSPERGFSMAMDALDGEHLAESTVVVARDGTGAVRGFLHFVPTYGRPAASLSFMRRDRDDVPNGLNDALVVRSIELLRDACGVEEVSLNFAAFARLIHSPDGAWERVLGRVARILNPFFQIESLYRFNAKFSPRWVPRHLCYEGSLLGWTQTSLAAAWAEGQLPKPAWGRERALRR